MKKIIGCIVGLFLLTCNFVGCVANTSNKNTEFVLQEPHLLKAWVGVWTEEKLEQAIKEYREQCETITMNNTDGASIVIETDFEPTRGKVVCLAKVDDEKEDFELNAYTDMYIKTECKDNRIIVHTEWWYLGGDGTIRYPEWSYLVLAEDGDGNPHYYYFRVQYSK